MPAEPDAKNKEHDAVVALARTMFEYGKFERTMSLLKLAEWLHPESKQVPKLRVETLVKLNRWEDALDEIMGNPFIDKVDNRLLAQVYWKLGERQLGDKCFRSTPQVATRSSP